ncbi:MAG TPA: glycosyltransferase [Kofleriaceae bacterium]|jgi:UDP:flavonoid glycosyltransferase YjiC (YdhE family)
MRAFLVVFSDAGHLNAMLAVAQHLEAQGHELTIFSVQDDVSSRCSRAGLRATCIVAAPASSVAREEAQRSVKLGQQIGNARWLKRWLSLTLVDGVAPVLERLEAAIRDAAPDLIVTDAMAYAGAVAATRAKLPWAALSTTALSLVSADDPLHAIFRDLGPARDEMMASLGAPLPFRGSDVISPHLNVGFAVKELFPDADLQLVGAAIPISPPATERPFPWDRIPSDRPLVLVCFGSHLSPKPDIYPAITNALTSDEAFFVVVLKDLINDPLAAALPSHVLAVDYAPQLQLLERCALMVHHAGANSVMECISRGVPMLCVPLGYDQHALGAAVARAGVGAVTNQEGVLGPDLRESLRELLAPDGPRRRAQSLAESSRHGAARATELLVHIGKGST